jgi:hypothetical protein
MRLFPVLIKRIAATSAGFIASVIQGGLAFSNRFSLIASSASPAVAIDITRQVLRGPTQVPAVTTSLLGAQGTAAKEGHTPAVDVDASLRDLSAASTPQNPAFSVAQRAETLWTTPTQVPAFDIDLLGASGTPVNQNHTPALDIDASLRDSAAANVSQVPSLELVRIQFDLTRRIGANASANVTGTWTRSRARFYVAAVGRSALVAGSPATSPPVAAAPTQRAVAPPVYAFKGRGRVVISGRAATGCCDPFLQARQEDEELLLLE